jgi:putative tributyrin esterase
MIDRDFFSIEFSDPKHEHDQLRYITLKSKNLHGRADISVFIPKNSENIKDLPLCILLHGVYGSHWAWSLKGGVHITAQKLIDSGQLKPMILAMPSDGLLGDGSAYLTHKSADYEKFIVEDVPKAIRLCCSGYTEKSKTFISGLSMGGYGAMRIGAKYPDIFTSFSGLSSVCTYQDLAQFLEKNDSHQLDQSVKNKTSIFEQILLNKKRLNIFRFDCGRDDVLFEDNKNLHEMLNHEGIKHVFEELDGKHEWPYWEKNIERSLLFFSDMIE